MAAAATNLQKSTGGGFNVNPVDGPFIRFPPFPTPPEGTTIIAFKEFTERGICIDPGPDDAEVDALGILTIPLPKPHKINMCKTNTKRKRKAEEATARKKAGALPARVLWHEQWAETEMIRFSHGFNPNSSRFERLHAAAGDFTTGRAWPTIYASETGPRYIWERFQRYIGIPEGTVAPQETKKGDNKDEDDDMSDDDIDEGDDEGDVDVNNDTAPSANVINDRDLPGIVAKKKAAASNEDKLSKFFDSPERSIRIFLSSHARAKGFIWSDVNLACMPRVLLFFFEFLIRSKVLPEIERSLRRSVEVITLAQTELPNSSGLAKAIPDIFSKACTDSWGKKADGYTVMPAEGDDDDEVKAIEAAPVAPEPEPEPKEEKPPAPAEVQVQQDSAWEQGIVPVWGSGADADSSPWGTSKGDGGWGKVEEPEIDLTSWTLPPVKGLAELGLEGMPATHRTGIVEASMRRIKSITPPNPNPPPKPAPAEGATGPDADAVEIDLDAKYTKVVLSPMPVDWDGGECPVYARPEILKTSQGPVVGGDSDPSEVPAGTIPGPKPHDSLNHEITLLVDPGEALVGLLSVGMSFGGTWVQIVRQGEVTKKKKKGKKKSEAPVYWYLEELAVIAPSFWAVEVESDDY